MNNRVEKLLQAINPDIDAVLITSDVSRKYLTLFSSSAGIALITRNKAYLLVDFRYIEAAQSKVKDFEVIMPSGRFTDTIISICKENGVKNIAFEDTKTTVAEYESLKKIYNEFTLLPLGNTINKLREKKDASEMEAVRIAQDITDKAFLDVLKMINRNMTETDVALELEYHMKKHGAQGFSFGTISVNEKSSALPHGVPQNKKLVDGFLTMDFGCLYDGYCSDMTRTVVIGKADEEMKKVYNTVLLAQTEAIKAAKVGVKCQELDKIARDIIYGAGYQGCFGHSLGHGVGLDEHETPNLSPNSGDIILEIGHIVTVEPGIYIKGKYGVRIEDIIQVTENGVIDITHSPKDLIEIE